MARFNAEQIRGYYDRQSQAFVALGQGGKLGAIHRAVWGPGVASRDEAFHYVEDQIANAVRELALPDGMGHLVDLGCGVGGSLEYLVERLPVRGTGVTISPLQARLAAERAVGRGLSARLRFVEGDYTQLPASIAAADVAFAIESFVHGPSPARFFAECARLIRPGGVLIVCDDVTRATGDPAAARAIERFQRGWHVNSLLTGDQVRAAAAAAGFAHHSTTDLTAWLELRRPRDRAIAAFLAVAGWLPLDGTRFAHIAGGHALQACLARGWIGYDLMRFSRAVSPAAPDG
jgi:tocopherol O-methyltransferase